MKSSAFPATAGTEAKPQLAAPVSIDSIGTSAQFDQTLLTVRVRDEAAGAAGVCSPHDHPA
jgi:hypothetical protein